MERSTPSPTLLSTPLGLPCGARLPNRLAKAAMSEQLATRHNVPSRRLVRLYTTWANSGIGLLITGNVMIDRAARSEPRQVVLDGRTDLAAVERWAAAGRAGGGHVWLQVNHAGRQAPRMLTQRPVAPSPVPVRGVPGAFATPRELTPVEIGRLVERFARTSELGIRAGSTGIQIHAAHGYLVSQFLSPRANRRTDAYGGDPDRRRRFLEEVVHAVRDRIGPSVPLSVKLNSADGQPGGVTAEESLETVRWLGSNGVDLIEISGGTFESADMVGRPADVTGPASPGDGPYFRTFAERARQVTRAPLMLTGGFRSRASMVAALDAGVADVVGLARPLVVDPHLPGALLTGTAHEARVPTITVPGLLRSSPVLVGMTEIGWHTRQLWHLGNGRRPRPATAVSTSVLRYLATQTVHAATSSGRGR